MSRNWFVLLALAAAGCTGVTNPVPVSGDVAALRGEWEGTYSSLQSGRTGSIYFRLEGGTDTARGDVIMNPLDPPGVSAPRDPSESLDPSRPRPEILTITFVRATAGTVSGRLDAYRDPQCGCRLTTTFTGELRGDTLSGRFSSWHEEMQHRTEGHWKVIRKPRGGG